MEDKQTTSSHKREKPNKVVIIGDSNVGKTCLIERYTVDKFGDTQPTIGALHKIKTVEDVQLDIWDTAGQERFKSMIPMYYKGAKAIIVAFDITSTTSFDGAKKWLQEIESNTSNILIVLIANKVDLESKRIISKETAKTFAEQKNIIYFETSAKDNINVSEVFEFIASEIKKMNVKSNNVINIKQDAIVQDNSNKCGCGF
jgi:small GTP-binding protein